jgi:MEMO1 family protein
MDPEKHLIASFSQKIPEIRYDIEIIPIQDNGRNLLYFHDPLEYLPQNFALDASVRPLLSIFSGAFTVEQVAQQLNGRITRDDLLEFIQLLDRHRVLNSQYYHSYSDLVERKFESGDKRPPSLAGESYPEDPNQLTAFLDAIIENKYAMELPDKAKALYAPHIDVEIGKSQYATSFSLLKNLRPKKVIILATAHYVGHHGDFYDGYPFIGSAKKFQIPGRSFKPEMSLIDILNEKGEETGFTISDRAHRVEHSIELHLLFASAVWKHDFTILPILVSGFDELFYHPGGVLAQKIDCFSSQLKSLLDDDTFILISGDLSHVGKKFGDTEPAQNLRKITEAFDRNFLNYSVKGQDDNLLQLISENYDATRVCGFPPLYTFLRMFPDLEGEQLNYYWWDEQERESAVSFGSILY